MSESGGTHRMGERREPDPAKEPAKEKEPEKEPEKKPTRYMVLSATSDKGPWQEIGWINAAGQVAAKKIGVKKVGDNAPRMFFLAIPESSYQPKKPNVITPEPTISF